ncbi:MAG: hypothetical protein JWR63_4391, partial [Conexibacter sp.]|nr:hypothetical protein [Conexibacter sp.]
MTASEHEPLLPETHDALMTAVRRHAARRSATAGNRRVRISRRAAVAGVGVALAGGT